MGGEVINIELGLVFEKYEKIFDEFVKEFKEMRLINEVYNTFGKLMINSLYGRMGMEDIDTEKIIYNKNEHNKKEKEYDLISFKIIGDYIIAEIKKKKKIKVKSNIFIASAITSKARIKLYNAQQDVVLNNGRLLYSDTDSIFASYNKDVSNEKHGIVD
jgi:hypothetical protein